MDIVSRILPGFLIVFFVFNTASSRDLRQAADHSFNEFSLFHENGKVGLKDSQGKVLITPQYEALGWSNGVFSVVNNTTGYRLNGQWGLISTSNQRITKAEYADISPGEGSIIVVRKKLPHAVRVQAGCINTAGKVVVPFQYDGLSISGLRAIVYTKTASGFNHGLIDFENKQLIPLQFPAIYPLGSLRYAVRNADNKIAIFSEQGAQLTAFLIDSIAAFKKNYAIIYQNQRQGLIDRAGQVKLEPTYREMAINDDGTISARMPDAWFFLDGNNSLLRQFNADSIKVIAPGLYSAQTDGRVQLVDRNFKPTHQHYFTGLGAFNNGLAIFDLFGKKGAVRTNGSTAIPAKFNQLVYDAPVFRATQRTDNNLRWVLVDSTGKQLTSRLYDYIGSYNGKFFPVQNKNFWGAVNVQGKEFIACVHDSVIQHRGNYVVVKFKGGYGIINMKEDWVITPQPNPITLIADDRYVVQAGRSMQLKSMTGNLIYFSDNPVEIKSDHLLENLPSGAIWKITLDGIIADRFVQPPAVEQIFPESEGLRAIKKDGKYGFIDNRGRLRVANRYENVKSFSEGLAAAMILGRWGFISAEDKIAIQPVYDEVFSFTQSVALVKQKEFFGLVDKKGKLVLPLRYHDIKVLPNKRFLINQNGLFGLADTNGKVLVHPKYDRIIDLNTGYILVGREGKFGVLTIEGISTVPLIYDALMYDAIHGEFIALKRAAWETIKL